MAERLEEREFKIPVLCEGTECVRCSHKLKEGLEELKGVAAARLDPDASTLTLGYDPNIVSFESLEQKARALGCALSQQFGHSTLTLTGLDCADCALKLEAAVRRQPGVVWVSANFATSKMSVEYEADKIDEPGLIKTISKLGYGVEEAAPPSGKISFWKRHARTISTLSAGLFLGAGLIAGGAGLNPAVSNALYAAAIFSGGYFVARGGWYSLANRTFDMNFLVLAAVCGAMIIGEWVEGAAVIFLFALGNALEAFSMERTRRVIKSLVQLAPDEALIRHRDHEDTVKTEDVKVGDVLIVSPGEKIAMDGVVIEGSSSVDQATVTGESKPVEKAPGDHVYAATLNQYGALEVRVTRTSKNNTIAKIIHLVENAQTHKAKTQLFTEKFGSYYTPVVMVSALFLATVPPLWTGAAFEPWVNRALVLLVVACPCALIISTPVALVSAIGSAARKGVLVKGGVYLEAVGKLKVFAFDKTGTLTAGRPEVTDVVSFSGVDENEVLTLALSLESRSEHPVAGAVIRAAKSRGLSARDSAGFQAVPGSGAFAQIGEETYYIGSWKFFEARALPLLARPDILQLEEDGKTVIFIGTENELIGALAMADEIRPETPEVLSSLRRLGLSPLVMLTGDNEPLARQIAERGGVDSFHAELLPEDKVELVKSLEQRYDGVAMVGDGVNDAPALASATVGIAMGAAGTDVALETADIALMSDDISKLPYTVELGRRTMRIIAQNIAFSLIVVALLIGATFGGYLTLSLGIVGHEGSALAVIFNGMRLLRD